MGKDTVNRLREQYPVGTRIELLKIDDAQAPPIGTRGTVELYYAAFSAHS